MAGFQTREDPVDDNENIRQFLADFHQTEYARLDEAKTKLRAEVIPRHLEHRVANVEVASCGRGDSGAIDGTQFRDGAGQRVDRARLPPGPWDRREGPPRACGALGRYARPAVPSEVAASRPTGNTAATISAAAVDQAADETAQPTATTPATVPTTSAEKTGTESGTVVAK